MSLTRGYYNQDKRNSHFFEFHYLKTYHVNSLNLQLQNKQEHSETLYLINFRFLELLLLYY